MFLALFKLGRMEWETSFLVSKDTRQKYLYSSSILNCILSVSNTPHILPTPWALKSPFFACRLFQRAFGRLAYLILPAFTFLLPRYYFRYTTAKSRQMYPETIIFFICFLNLYGFLVSVSLVSHLFLFAKVLPELFCQKYKERRRSMKSSIEQSIHWYIWRSDYRSSYIIFNVYLSANLKP